MDLLTIGCIAGAAVLLLIILFWTCYVQAPPSKALIISGFTKEPRTLIGTGGFQIPILERKDVVYLGQIGVDIRTKESVPTLDFINVNIDAVAKVQVLPTPEGVRLAAKNFLNVIRSCSIFITIYIVPILKRSTTTNCFIQAHIRDIYT